jgi:hypothetical protein
MRFSLFTPEIACTSDWAPRTNLVVAVVHREDQEPTEVFRWLDQSLKYIERVAELSGTM